MLYIILFSSFFIGLIVFFIYELYSYYKSCKVEKEEWEDFIKSLIPGSEWILQQESSLNPFAEPPSDTIVTIIETRRNSYGDIWVQYQFKDCESIFRELEVNIFKELYTKLD